MPTPSTCPMVIPAALVPYIPLPRLELLSGSRMRGAECVWGGERLTGKTAIDLGKHTDNGFNWFPRACLRCTRGAVRAARDNHADRCTACEGPSAMCDTGRSLHNLLNALADEKNEAIRASQ
ncbi:hypothetical protein [Streptomyces sp. WELS2]|uniref:hypothetical protein n=1 Tax=Streptomyces sp. WELS2 TaxID=2749435 RepID=UPI0015EFE93A|nr:hypothetical protein [Streptomyces sp. WELS2]